MNHNLNLWEKMKGGLSPGCATGGCWGAYWGGFCCAGWEKETFKLKRWNTKWLWLQGQPEEIILDIEETGYYVGYNNTSDLLPGWTKIWKDGCAAGAPWLTTTFWHTGEPGYDGGDGADAAGFSFSIWPFSISIWRREGGGDTNNSEKALKFFFFISKRVIYTTSWKTANVWYTYADEAV